MDESKSAEIIAFPLRHFPTVSPAAEPSARLTAALSALSAALAEQQIAVQRWRDAMTELAGCMRALGGSAAVVADIEQHI